MVQERTQQFLAIQEVSDLRQKTTTELVQTLVEKIADISEVFGNEESSKLPDVSSTRKLYFNFTYAFEYLRQLIAVFFCTDKNWRTHLS